MSDFSSLKRLTIPEGVVTQIADESGAVIWAAGNDPVILEVEKITSDTYAGETTYTGEQFILLNIYPKTNGTVKVTYGGLTKTITDTSGAAEPNAQQVFFGTFNGVSDSIATPISGELTIEGNFYAFGCSSFSSAANKTNDKITNCVAEIVDLGNIEVVPVKAFMSCSKIEGNVTIPEGVTMIGASAFAGTKITSITLPTTMTFIGSLAFSTNDYLATVYMLATTPPNLEQDSSGGYSIFDADAKFSIIVPKGCGATYKAATGWSKYANKIVEAS